MKKLFSIFGIMFAFCFIFTGCGVSGSNAISAIKFDKPIVYVDQECNIKLGYNVYPSTANNFTVNYSHDNENNYQLIDGVFRAENLFESVLITINASNKSDNCLVVRKLYPSGCYLTHSSIGGQSIGTVEANKLKVNNGATPEITMTTNASTSLQMFGMFDREFNIAERTFKKFGTPQIKSLNGEVYNFKMTSSDPTVVAVAQEDILQIRSTGKSGSATIMVELVKDNGASTNILARMNVNVVNPIQSIDVYCNGNKIENGCAGKFEPKDESSEGYYQTNPIVFKVLLVDSQDKIVSNESILKNITISTLGNERLVLQDPQNGEVKTLVGIGGEGIKYFEFSLIVKDKLGTYQTSNADRFVISCNYLIGAENVDLYKVISFYGSNS